MKLLTVFSTTVLAVVLGISAPVFAQDEHPQEEKRTSPDDKAAHPEKQEDKQVDKDKDKEKDNKQIEKEKDNKQAVQENRQDEKPAHTEQQGEQRAGKEGGRIPEDRFRANFGRQHTFQIGHPVIVAGTPRFQYGGYWFVFVQPWPVGWAYTDVVYVDYIDGGYFLLSPVHPGIQISINVIL